jgi:cytidyltransferase-like protein
MIIATFGSFDILHIGHIKFLEKCAEFGEVIVGLSTDKYIQEKKDHESIMCYKDRQRVLLALKSVSRVIENDNSDIQKTLLELRYGKHRNNLEDNSVSLAIGKEWYDRKFMEERCLKPEWLGEHGISLICITVDNESKCCSTDFRKKLT